MAHSEHPSSGWRQGRLVRRDGGLHAGGEEQGESLATRPAGVHLAGDLDPVGQLTGTDERGREHDLASEQAFGGVRCRRRLCHPPFDARWQQLTNQSLVFLPGVAHHALLETPGAYGARQEAFLKKHED